MDAFVIIYLAVVFAVVLLMAYFVSDSFYVLVSRLLGRPVIVVRGTSSAIRGQCWKTVLKRDAWGCGMAYRYPAVGIGVVKINPDGTGEYCGRVEWKRL